jgi:hypothetical protein
MATSSTYAFSPNVGDLVMNAFGRIQIRRTEITQQHLQDAATEANMVQVEFSNRQPNLFSAETYTVSLVEGTATYALPARMISPMAVYLTTTNTGGVSTDRILYGISTYEYAALPNKEQEAPPTSFWYDRLSTPQVTLWPVPDGNATYTLNLRILSQFEDATVPNGVTPDLPYRFLDAYTAALAARLAAIYQPSIEDKRKADAERAWQIAAKEDYENVPTYFMPGLSGYFR